MYIYGLYICASSPLLWVTTDRQRDPVVIVLRSVAFQLKSSSSSSRSRGGLCNGVEVRMAHGAVQGTVDVPTPGFAGHSGLDSSNRVVFLNENTK